GREPASFPPRPGRASRRRAAQRAPSAGAGRGRAIVRPPHGADGAPRTPAGSRDADGLGGPDAEADRRRHGHPRERGPSTSAPGPSAAKTGPHHAPAPILPPPRYAAAPRAR